jgi:Lsr2
MAQKVEVTLVDDLDGGQADETVAFSLDGTQYEIDLSKDNATKLRDELSRFVGAGRKVGGGRKQGRAARKTVNPDQPSSHEVREWAREQGIKVSERGRIPADVVVKFQQAKAS